MKTQMKFLLSSIIYTHNIYPLTNKPTRITKESATLFDNILTSEITSTIKIGILLSDVTDHFPIFFC